MTREDAAGNARRVLIIVQNLPVPFDRRVWLECRALVEAGYQVAVICPSGPGDPPYEVLQGVELYKYPLRTAASGSLAYFGEYARSFAMTALLAVRARRRGWIDAIQTCNPPDIFWPLGISWRAISGTRFVFDQHHPDRDRGPMVLQEGSDRHAALRAVIRLSAHSLGALYQATSC